MAQNEIFKLDMKDKKILYELDRNSTQTDSQIAKKVGLSPEVVNYRINRLEKEGVITNYPTALNLSKLGLVHFKILLCFHHITSKKLEEVIERLRKDRRVKWVVSCKGAWDMLITIETEDINEVDLTKNEILSLFSGYISKKALSIGVGASAYTRSFLLDTNKKEEMVLLDKSKKERLDKIDFEIIKELSKNSRKSAVDIATELNTTARIVSYRIKQLIKRGIITGFRLAVNYEKIGLLFYKCMIYLDNPNENKIKGLIHYFKYNKNIIHNVQVLGNWELEPEFEVFSEKEFDDCLKEMKDNFSEIISSIEIITISKEHKFIYF